MATLDPTRLAASPLARFGEPVTLPTGAVVGGIFDPVGTPADGLGSDLGLRGRLSAQPNPLLDLADADAAGLLDGARVTVRGVTYLITRMDPDGHGLTRCLLMPAGVSGSDGLARYR